MELIGQFDSPFARRVGITLDLYGLMFKHNKWSVFGNANALAQVNPLIRVPTLVLDTGEALIETWSIIDYIDGLVATEKRLWPQVQPQRYEAQKIAAVATGVSDKAVTLFYEQRLHDEPSQAYMSRLLRQIEGALEWLETACTRLSGPYWIEGRLTQADLAVACGLRHLSESHPGVLAADRYPSLAAFAARCEALAVFKRVSQPFVAPT
jgi:glutathione S-transferase